MKAALMTYLDTLVLVFEMSLIIALLESLNISCFIKTIRPASLCVSDFFALITDLFFLSSNTSLCMSVAVKWPSSSTKFAVLFY